MAANPSPLVSIIIPLYNAEKYIAETIQSALDQTWPDKEIIIINDGSTDNSLAIAKEYASENVKIYAQENKGASAARNYGLNEAKGEYIQFLDADDLLSPNKISSQMNLLIKYPDYIGLCGTIHFDDGTDPSAFTVKHEWYSEGSDDPADFLIKLYGGDLIGPQYGGMVQPNAWLTPRTLIDTAGLWNEMRNPDDDGEFFCRVILAAKGVKYAEDGINFYRKFINVNSLSAQKNYEACKNILESNCLKAKYLAARTNDPRSKIALSRLFWENVVNFYPEFPDLSARAEKLAHELDPSQKPAPYKSFPSKYISDLLGWKRMKLLSQWRTKWS